ncbi:Mrp/NBP35 family ATP-binding protein [Actinomarinicola tropica]|uniref:Mrp/NBP35 family ATP-binding protein n=1 Tax=Actinomarinicola tropica TaxID=2789776 RepID=UPI001E34509C|nr:Mrp/NBP35 family ATP-binding protein [Actinomarinicola tropica]
MPPTTGSDAPPTVAPPTHEDVVGVLRGVVDPELGSDVVDLGMAKDVAVDADGTVRVTVALTTAGCPLRAQLQRDVRTRVGSMPGVTDVRIEWTEMTAEEKATAMDRARWNARADAPDTLIPATTRVVAVASGKGGVGKSSVTVNLAVAVAARGYRVGVLDADIWGFSVPRMLGLEGRLGGAGDGPTPEGERPKIAPITMPVGDGQLEVVSMGFLVDAEETALMWRGLMLNRAVQHFVEDVAWGDLDYLFIDMPPGTGDVAMGLARMLPRAEMLVVTTPALTAQKVAIRAASMARRSHLRVAGVIENMSAFVCDHGESYPLFGSGGGELLARDAGVPLLGQIPLEPSVADGGDNGRPIALGEGPAADAFRDLAAQVVEEAIPPVEMAGCSARMLDAAVSALDDLDL